MTEAELYADYYNAIQEEINRLGYAPSDFKHGVDNAIITAVVSFDDADNYGEYNPANGCGGYGESFTLDGLFQYVDDCGGWMLFDWEV